MDGFQEWLKSGHILCALMNNLAPGSIRKINNTENVKMAVSFITLSDLPKPNVTFSGTKNEQGVREHFLFPVSLFRLWH